MGVLRAVARSATRRAAACPDHAVDRLALGSRERRLPPTGGFAGVACVSNTACTAVGWSLAVTESPLIDRLDGGSWAVQATPVLTLRTRREVRASEDRGLVGASLPRVQSPAA